MSQKTVLHVIQRLTGGGAGRCLITMASHSGQSGPYRHRVVSLLPAEAGSAANAEARGIEVVDWQDRSALVAEIAQADIVQVHFWNTPELYSLLRSDLPPMRLLIYAQIGGYHAPHVITGALIHYADYFLTSSTYSQELAVFDGLPPEQRTAKVGMMVNVADLARVSATAHRTHDSFCVGYIGTLAPIKMHPNFIAMCAATEVPTIRFIVCGSSGNEKRLWQQADEYGLRARVDFRGYVEKIGPVLAEMDLFGYPLCEDNYSASDLVVQEAMAAGLPTVLFAYGGAPSLILHNETGLIVQSEEEYCRAIEYLYAHPEERTRLGENAQRYARAHFGAEKAIAQLHPIYERLLALPKSQQRLADVRQDATGAAHFVAGLGSSAPYFAISLAGTEIIDVLAAEERIAALSPVLCHEAAGGIFHYRNYYPQDGHLRLWSGLALMGQGQNVRALSELQTAIAQGCDHWRVWWYVAQTATRLRAMPLASAALQRVSEAALHCEEAQRLLANFIVEEALPEGTPVLNAAAGEHVMIFDLSRHIHLPSYLRHLIRFWIRNQLAGRLSIVVWHTFLREHDDVVQLAESAPDANIQFVVLTEAEKRKKLARARDPSATATSLSFLLHQGRLNAGERQELAEGQYYAAHYDWELYCRYATELGATQSMIVHVDGYLPLLAAGAAPPVPLSGIYFAPTFHYRELLGESANAWDPAQALRERFVLARALREPQLQTLFFLDPFAVIPAGKVGAGVKAVYLPDPVQLQVATAAASDALRRTLGIEAGRRVFLLFGHLARRKGVEALMAAAEMLPNEICRRVCIVLAGPIDPQYYAEIEQIIQATDAAGSIQIVRKYGYIADAELSAYFALADVVLTPYQRHAGMSGILLLAAAAQKPILSSDYGLMGELVRRYALGLTVDSGAPEAIAAALVRFVEGEPSDFCNPEQMARLVAEHQPEQFAATIFERLGVTDQSFISSVL